MCRRCGGGGLDDAIHDGVAEVHVGTRHIDLGAEHPRSLFKFALVHALEEIEVFLHRAVAVGALDAGLGGSALLCGYLFRGLIVDIGFALLDQPHGQIP